MAIDRVKRLTLLVPAYKSLPLVSGLYRLGIIHVTDVFSSTPAARTVLRKYGVTPHDDGGEIQRLQFITSTLSPFLDHDRSFLEGLFPTPLHVRREEFEDIVSSLDIDGVYNDCKALYDEQTAIDRELKDVRQEKDSLRVLYGLPWALHELRAVRRVTVRLGILSNENWRRFTLDLQTGELLAWQDTTPTPVRQKRVLVAYLPGVKEKAEALLDSHGFRELAVPDLPCRAEERASELERQERILLERQETLRGRMRRLAGHHYRRAEVLLGYRESEKERETQEAGFARSKKLLLITGYIRTKDVSKLETMLKTDCPRHAAIYEDPSPDEDVPVSLSLNPLFRPVQLLTNMFGLPNYFTFDPTPYIVLNFLLFFGICFGDVVYGIMLMGLSYYMMRRYRQAPDLRNFFCLFFYAGVSTVICGALTGGWAGDLYKAEYLGENNILLRLKETLGVFDPLSNILVALILVLGLGVLNQFYALFLRMYREYRMGRPLDALLDGGLWLIFLPGLVILISSAFVIVPPGLLTAGKTMTVLGAVGLVLTQGRKQEGVAAKLITGIVSVYGILGTYGSTTFIGDILSYSRLLALGLTTSIIAMSFNIIAALAGSAGIIFFILALIIGHLLNFAICIIGSFVHPARLIMLEFFGRFYEAGAVRFRPFGFRSERVRIVE